VAVILLGVRAGWPVRAGVLRDAWDMRCGTVRPMHSHAALAEPSAQGVRWAKDDVLGGMVKVAAAAG